jgi:hypothetical protein
MQDLYGGAHLCAAHIVRRFGTVTRSRRILRLAASACLALYLTLVAGVPVLHAMDAAPQTVETHVHGDDEACPPWHDELHCPTCTVATAAREPASGGAAPLSTGGHTGSARAPSDEDAPSSAASAPSLPRGPPALR